MRRANERHIVVSLRTLVGQVPEKYESVFALFVNEAAYYEKKATRAGVEATAAGWPGFLISV